MKVQRILDPGKCDPGIYCFRNRINGKCYIGQAINLENRYKAHMLAYKRNGNCVCLYRAFNKYGIDSFDYFVVERVELCDNIKEILDELEKKYIKEYDSYNNGYNLTQGGDAGVLGLRMTDEQKRKIGDNSIKLYYSGKYSIYVYDIKDKSITQYVNIRDFCQRTNANYITIKNSIRRKSCYQDRYYFSRNTEFFNSEEFKNIINKKNIKKGVNNYVFYNNKAISIEEFYNILINKLSNENFSSLTLLANEFCISRYTLTKRMQKLKRMGYNFPETKNTKHFVDYIILIDIVNNVKEKCTRQEFSEKFNIKYENALKVIAMYKDGKLYRKHYKIEVIYKNNGNNI